MHIKAIMSICLTLNCLFSVSQKNESNHTEKIQSSLDSLNAFIKVKFDETIEINGKKIYLIDNKKISNEKSKVWYEGKIKDLGKVIKFPNEFNVSLPCNNDKDCINGFYMANNERKSVFPINNYGYYSISFTCNSEIEMDKLFELFSNFWFDLTGINSATKYTNAELTQLYKGIKEDNVLLIDFDKDESDKKQLSKYKNQEIYASYLYLNNDLETYRGNIVLPNNYKVSVKKIKIQLIKEKKVREYKVVNNTESKSEEKKQISIVEEAADELRKLDKEIIEYNESMKMYIKDCEKDKKMKYTFPYGKSTACRALVNYNEIIKSAIERFLKKYGKYISSEDVSRLNRLKKKAEENIIVAKY
ncbi:MAG: hypothetical protein JSR12_04595 [Bacteroidetes bacterium]|nr:hypothetical protein [Bacteroidota bacterium]